MDKDGKISFEIVLRESQSVDSVRRWLGLSESEMRREVAYAIIEKNLAQLWSLFEAYLVLHGSARADISEKTLINYSYGLKKLLRFVRHQNVNLLYPERDLGYKYKSYLSSIRREKISLQNQNATLTPLTIRWLIGAARRFYQSLNWAGVISINPFADVKVARDSIMPWERRSAYSEFEIECLLAKADEEMRLLLLLGAHGGLRISETLNLMTDDIEISSMTLTVRKGKGRKRRKVSIGKNLSRSIAQLDAGSRQIFMYSPCKVRIKLKRLCNEADITYRGHHALRHYCGTRLMSQTGSIEIVAQHLGHVSTETTRTYIKIDDTLLQSEIGSWL